MEVQSKARLVETPPSAERGVTATLSRSDVEETLKSADGPAMLVLDIARKGDEGEVEAHTLEVELEKPDLEEILRTSAGDAIELRFDGTELEQALEADVDAHGLRQKALILSVAAATAAGVAGQASGMQVVEGGGGGGVAAAPISDVMSGGPAGAEAASTQFASDVVSGGPAGAQASESQLSAAMAGGAEWPREAAAASQEQTPLVSDVSGGGPAGAQAAETQFASDVVSGGPAGAQAAETQFASDVVSGGPAGAQASESELSAAMAGGAEWPREAAAASQEQTPLVSDVSGGGPAGAQAAEATAQTPLVSDVAGGGPATAPPASVEATGGGSGITISSGDAQAAALAGGLLLITGAGLVAAKRHKGGPAPA